MERPALQLHELQELQKQHMDQMQKGPQRYEDAGFASEEAEQTPNPGDERGLRDFNYNGRVRNGERASERASSAVLGQHHPPRNSVSIYSTYSSYPPSLDGGGDVGQDRGGVEGGGGVGNGLGGATAGGNSSGFGRGIPPPRPPRSPPPPLPHIEQPGLQPSMEVPPAPGTANTMNTIGTEATAVAGTESVQKVRQPNPPPPPPTYDPSQEHYSRVRFVDEGHRRQEEGEEAAAAADRGNSGSRPIDKAQITGGHSTRVLWVFACCSFFCYRCFMDENF